MNERKMVAAGGFKLADTGSIELSFAQLNIIDSDGDVTLAGAFPAKDVPMSAYGHTSWDGALPIGKGSIEERGDWAIFTGQFFMETTHGRDAYETVKGLGQLAEYSYGYNVTDGGPGTFDGKRVRELRKLDVFEVSPVLKGAGVGTGTLAIKSGAPGTDAPFATQLSWYTEGLPALIDRIKGHAAARGKEGRKLSRADRAALEDLVDSLDGQLSAARDLLSGDTPVDPAKQAEFARVAQDNIVALAAHLGVPLA